MKLDALFDKILTHVPEKLRPFMAKLLNREMFFYLLFGVMTTLVNFAVYYGLRAVNVAYMLAEAAAWIVAVIFAYLTNKLWVFESRSFKASVVLREAASFAAARIITGLLEAFLLLGGVEWLGFGDRPVKLVASVLVVILNYVFSKLFIFKKESVHEEAEKKL